MENMNNATNRDAENANPENNGNNNANLENESGNQDAQSSVAETTVNTGGLIGENDEGNRNISSIREEAHDDTVQPEEIIVNDPLPLTVVESVEEKAHINELEVLSDLDALDAVADATENEENESAAAEPEHEEEQEHDHLEEEIDLEGFDKNELLKIVQDAIHSAESRISNINVQHARSEFFKIVEEEKREAKEKFEAEEGNEGAEFTMPADPLVRDFNQAFRAFKKKRQEYIADLNRQKELNLQLKKEIIEKLKELTESTETHSSFQDVKKIQEEWKKIGHVPIAEAENLWNSYNFYINKFYDQLSLYSEFKELDRKRNLEAKEEIVNRIVALGNQEDMSEAMRSLKQLQDEWRHVGPVPKENVEDVINRYKAAVVFILDKREKLSEEMQKRREQNYEAKIAVMEKIQEIAGFESKRVQDWIDKNQELGEWIEKWRAIGSVPMNKRQEMKQQFTAAIRGFNKGKNEFFRLRKKEKVDNLKKKIELCEKVEELLTSEDLQAHKKQVIHLQDEWKKSGPVPPKYSDKVWKRFQAACDDFFAKLSSRHNEQEKEFLVNLEQKNALIEKAEALLTQENIENAGKEIRQLQDEWNKIGFVPFKEKDKIRKRFFKALNAIAAKNKVAGTEGGAGGEDNLSYQLMLESWAHNQDGERRLDQEERRLVREIRKLEGEVATLENNMQFFSKSKTADKLKDNLDRQISRLKEKIAELQDKIRIVKKVDASA